MVVEDYSRTINTITLDYDLIQPEPLQATATETTIFCGERTTVSVSVSGGTQPYNYEWSTGDNTPSVGNVGAGRFFVFVRDANGCEITALATVSTPSDLKISGTVSHPVCFEASNGSIRTQVSGGTAPYLYEWSTGAVTQDISGISAGRYYVTVTDNEGCSYTETFELTNPEPISVYLGEDKILCKGQEWTIEPEVEDSETTFRWSGPAAFSSAESKVTVSKEVAIRLRMFSLNKGGMIDDRSAKAAKEHNIQYDKVLAAGTYVILLETPSERRSAKVMIW